MNARPPLEIAVVSGKGGTGKTSVTAALANHLDNWTLADCDVDAPNLHLLAEPQVELTEAFFSGSTAVIDQDMCIRCGGCMAVCRFEAIRFIPVPDGPPRYEVDPARCEGCQLCGRLCPEMAIAFLPAERGTWHRSTSRFGPMVHARLRPGGENSGKLVAQVRNEARQLARQRGCGGILIDGPPGIGCPVIASLTGVDLAVVVTEASAPGAHDLDRLQQLLAHFQIPAMLCVNKWDLHPELTERLEAEARDAGVDVVCRVPFDESVVRAQAQGRSPLDLPDSPAGAALETLAEAVGEWTRDAADKQHTPSQRAVFAASTDQEDST